MNKLSSLTLFAAVGLTVAGFSAGAFAQETTSASNAKDESSSMESSMEPSAMAPADTSAMAPMDASSSMMDMSAAFKAADKDGDGFVDIGEATAAMPNLGEKAFNDVDTNKDDKLDATEFSQLGGINSTVETGNSGNGKTSSSASN